MRDARHRDRVRCWNIECGHRLVLADFRELKRERLLPLEEVVEKARAAKHNGASRFCMGAAWRNPTDKNLDKVIEMMPSPIDVPATTEVRMTASRSACSTPLCAQTRAAPPPNATPILVAILVIYRRLFYFRAAPLGIPTA